MATPTPTPTPTPVWYLPPSGTQTPTATPGWLGGGAFSGGGEQPGGGSGGGSRGFGDDWPTPTFYPTSAATPGLVIQLTPEQLPYAIVQGYNTVNQQGLLDTTWLFAVIFVIIGGTFSLYKRFKVL